MEPGRMKVTPQWSKSKEEIWNEAFSGLEEVPKRRSITWRGYAAAAAVLIISVGLLTARYYSVSETTARGTSLAFRLPDGSSVRLNADSRLTYHPYWWPVNRKVMLEGEACFEVARGKRFTVASEKNEVHVLGTRFNVFSRPERYCVTCFTGKVEVTGDDRKTLLQRNMQLTCRNGDWKVEEQVDAVQTVGWTEQRFIFSGVPLTEVIAEIERQYDIRVTADTTTDYLYTGNFSKTKSPEEVLAIVGKPFGITFSVNK